MTTIFPFLEEGAFDPQDVEAMSTAFNGVCKALNLSGDIRAKEAVAVRIIELARRGERSAVRLCYRVLSEASRSAQA